MKINDSIEHDFDDSVAFNRGSDARLAGLPISRCPYTENVNFRKRWEEGWKDVDKHWGRGARWPYAKLVEVRLFPPVIGLN